jgi:hypothetical protein
LPAIRGLYGSDGLREKNQRTIIKNWNLLNEIRLISFFPLLF